MADVLTKSQRSYCMSRIRSRDTGLEMLFEKYMKSGRLKGFRKGHSSAGKPDFIFPRSKVALFLDGCFWHGCPRCYREPKTNKKFWRNKIIGNKKRDKISNSLLRQGGWRIKRFWGHQVKTNPERCMSSLKRMLDKS